jgi:hypothetical protein
VKGKKILEKSRKIRAINPPCAGFIFYLFGLQIMATHRNQLAVQNDEPATIEHGDYLGMPLKMPDDVVRQWVNKSTGERFYLPVQTLPGSANQAPEPDLPEDVEETATDRVSAMLSVAGGDATAKVIVSRIRDGKRSYVFECSPEQFEVGGFKMIQDSYGAGSYEIKLMGRKMEPPANGRYVIRGHQIVDIESAPLMLNPSSAVSGTGDNNAFVQLIQVLDKRLQMFENQMQKTSPENDLEKTLAIMERLGGIMGQQKSTATPMRELIDLNRDMREMAKEMVPGNESGGDNLMSLAGQALSLITSQKAAAQAQQLQHVQQAMPAVALPQNFEPTQPQSEPQQNEGVMAQLNPIEKMVVGSFVNALNKRAASGEVVTEQYAGEVLNALPENVLSLILLPDWWAVLTQLLPQVLPFPDWYASLRNEIVRLYNDDSSPD